MFRRWRLQARQRLHRARRMPRSTHLRSAARRTLGSMSPVPRRIQRTADRRLARLFRGLVERQRVHRRHTGHLMGSCSSGRTRVYANGVQAGQIVRSCPPPASRRVFRRSSPPSNRRALKDRPSRTSRRRSACSRPPLQARFASCLSSAALPQCGGSSLWSIWTRRVLSYNSPASARGQLSTIINRLIN